MSQMYWAEEVFIPWDLRNCMRFNNIRCGLNYPHFPDEASVRMRLPSFSLGYFRDRFYFVKGDDSGTIYIQNEDLADLFVIGIDKRPILGICFDAKQGRIVAITGGWIHIIVVRETGTEFCWKQHKSFGMKNMYSHLNVIFENEEMDLLLGGYELSRYRLDHRGIKCLFHVAVTKRIDFMDLSKDQRYLTTWSLEDKHVKVWAVESLGDKIPQVQYLWHYCQIRNIEWSGNDSHGRIGRDCLLTMAYDHKHRIWRENADMFYLAFSIDAGTVDPDPVLAHWVDKQVLFRFLSKKTQIYYNSQMEDPFANILAHINPSANAPCPCMDRVKKKKRVFRSIFLFHWLTHRKIQKRDKLRLGREKNGHNPLNGPLNNKLIENFRAKHEMLKILNEYEYLMYTIGDEGITMWGISEGNNQVEIVARIGCSADKEALARLKMSRHILFTGSNKFSDAYMNKVRLMTIPFVDDSFELMPTVFNWDILGIFSAGSVSRMVEKWTLNMPLNFRHITRIQHGGRFLIVVLNDKVLHVYSTSHGKPALSPVYSREPGHMAEKIIHVQIARQHVLVLVTTRGIQVRNLLNNEVVEHAVEMTQGIVGCCGMANGSVGICLVKQDQVCLYELSESKQVLESRVEMESSEESFVRVLSVDRGTLPITNTAIYGLVSRDTLLFVHGSAEEFRCSTRFKIEPGVSDSKILCNNRLDLLIQPQCGKVWVIEYADKYRVRHFLINDQALDVEWTETAEPMAVILETLGVSLWQRGDRSGFQMIGRILFDFSVPQGWNRAWMDEQSFIFLLSNGGTVFRSEVEMVTDRETDWVEEWICLIFTGKLDETMRRAKLWSKICRFHMDKKRPGALPCWTEVGVDCQPVGHWSTYQKLGQAGIESSVMESVLNHLDRGVVGVGEYELRRLGGLMKYLWMVETNQLENRLDEAARLFLYLYLNLPNSKELDSEALMLGYLSTTQEILLQQIEMVHRLEGKQHMEWEEYRQSRMVLWVKDFGVLKKVLEGLAGRLILQDRRKTMLGILLLVALRRVPLLIQLLIKSSHLDPVVSGTKKSRLIELFRLAPDSDAARTKAIKNGYVCLGKQQYNLSVAMFILGGHVEDGLAIGYRYLDDQILTLTVARCCGDGKYREAMDRVGLDKPVARFLQGNPVEIVREIGTKNMDGKAEIRHISLVWCLKNEACWNKHFQTETETVWNELLFKMIDKLGRRGYYHCVTNLIDQGLKGSNDLTHIWHLCSQKQWIESRLDQKRKQSRETWFVLDQALYRYVFGEASLDQGEIEHRIERQYCKVFAETRNVLMYAGNKSLAEFEELSRTVGELEQMCIQCWKIEAVRRGVLLAFFCRLVGFMLDDRWGVVQDRIGGLFRWLKKYIKSEEVVVYENDEFYLGGTARRLDFLVKTILCIYTINTIQMKCNEICTIWNNGERFEQFYEEIVMRFNTMLMKNRSEMYTCMNGLDHQAEGAMFVNLTKQVIENLRFSENVENTEPSGFIEKYDTLQCINILVGSTGNDRSGETEIDCEGGLECECEGCEDVLDEDRYFQEIVIRDHDFDQIVPNPVHLDQFVSFSGKEIVELDALGHGNRFFDRQSGQKLVMHLGEKNGHRVGWKLHQKQWNKKVVMTNHPTLPFYLAGAEVAQGLELYRFNEMEPVSTFVCNRELDGEFSKIQFSKNGTHFVASTRSGLAFVWVFQMETSEPMFQLRARGKELTDACFIESIFDLAVVDETGLVVYDLLLSPCGEVSLAYNAYTHRPKTCVFIKTKGLVATGGSRGEICVFETKRQKLLLKLNQAHPLKSTILYLGTSIHNGAETMLSACDHGHVYLWDLETFATIKAWFACQNCAQCHSGRESGKTEFPVRDVKVIDGYVTLMLGNRIIYRFLV